MTKYVTLVGTVARPGEHASRRSTGSSSCSTPTASTPLPRPAASCTSRAALLGLMKNEAELAGVLGHEITHVTEKHTINAIQQEQELISADADRQARWSTHGRLIARSRSKRFRQHPRRRVRAAATRTRPTRSACGSPTRPATTPNGLATAC